MEANVYFFAAFVIKYGNLSSAIHLIVFFFGI